jgi:pimeloyl-ACP methyl ester carboxylesterase
MLALHVVHRRIARFVALLLAVALHAVAAAGVPVDEPAIAHRTGGSRGPAVVFQSGLDDGLATWRPVLARLDADQRVWAYDRPGYGDSPARPGPRDACTIAAELRTALQRAAVPPPYLLVGHSLGGLYQLAFAKLYPGEVAGVLLLDPTHPQHWARLQQQAPGVATALMLLRSTAFTAVMRQEFDDQEGCTQRLAELPAPQVPARLLVRTRYGLGETAAFQRVVRDLQDDWVATQLPGLRRAEATGSGHYIHHDRTDLVLAQLAELLAAPRACSLAR